MACKHSITLSCHQNKILILFPAGCNVSVSPECRVFDSRLRLVQNSNMNQENYTKYQQGSQRNIFFGTFFWCRGCLSEGSDNKERLPLLSDSNLESLQNHSFSLSFWCKLYFLKAYCSYLQSLTNIPAWLFTIAFVIRVPYSNQRMVRRQSWHWKCLAFQTRTFRIRVCREVKPQHNSGAQSDRPACRIRSSIAIPHLCAGALAKLRAHSCLWK